MTLTNSVFSIRVKKASKLVPVRRHARLASPLLFDGTCRPLVYIMQHLSRRPLPSTTTQPSQHGRVNQGRRQARQQTFTDATEFEFGLWRSTTRLQNTSSSTTD